MPKQGVKRNAQPKAKPAKRIRCKSQPAQHQPKKPKEVKERSVSGARHNFCSILAELLRLDIIGIQKINDATDVHRLELTARVLKQQNIARWEIAAILALDWAVRSPELSATFLENLCDRDYDHDAVDDKDVSAIEQYRALLNSKEWRRYWTGRSKLNLLNFAKHIGIHDLMSFGYHFEYQFDRMRVTTLLREIQNWTFMGPYLSYTMVRCVASAMQVRLRDATTAATNMSAHTQHLSDALGFSEIRKALRKLSGINPCDGLLGFYLCETTKLLKETSVLKELRQYKDNPAQLIRDLESDAAEGFMHHLQEFGQVPVPAGAETTAQIAAMPEEFNIHRRQVTTNTLQRWKALTEAASS